MGKLGLAAGAALINIEIATPPVPPLRRSVIVSSPRLAASRADLSKPVIPRRGAPPPLVRGPHQSAQIPTREAADIPTKLTARLTVIPRARGAHGLGGVKSPGRPRLEPMWQSNFHVHKMGTFAPPCGQFTDT